MNERREEERYMLPKVPLEFYHLFLGKPQCALVDDVYVSDKHLHKEVEMAFVVSGQVEIMADKHEFTVSAGELLCIRENVLHQYQPKKQNADIVKIKFLKEWLMPAFFQVEEKDAVGQLYGQIFKTRPDEAVRCIVRAMMDCALTQYKEYFYFGKIIELTACLLASPEMIVQIRPVALDNQRYMEQAIDYMQENCYEKLTLKMLSDHLGLTETYCSKYIKKNTGISFVDYLNAIRINNAQRLLLNTDYSIMEIVERTGFSSVQTFNRVFKGLTGGLSPSAYRKSKRRKER